MIHVVATITGQTSAERVDRQYIHLPYNLGQVIVDLDLVVDQVLVIGHVRSDITRQELTFHLLLLVIIYLIIYPTHFPIIKTKSIKILAIKNHRKFYTLIKTKIVVNTLFQVIKNCS